ncbi:type II restriction enzyme [Vagococcus silagei]|uniref:Uncharacterized protein n=1 Tax=Vagococcus silagei TaxID=2508885 RepID=A0A4S3B3M8_9ENTE|nr:hypothetical protein [Vagococcus silagei]THB61412.1 hypothetical protein ESZ54_05040 [Vagococcus silagei]
MKKEFLTKNDEAWGVLFEKLRIVNEVKNKGVFQISSKQINQIGQREARLMTKFDHKNNLPSLFRENNLSILPNSRGTYLIGNFKTHGKVEYDKVLKPIKKRFPNEILTIDPKSITSEAIALNVAYASGMIDEVIETLSETYSFLTLTNRLGSKELRFSIDSNISKQDSHNIIVKNSQIEIDSTYENLYNIGIFEAKLGTPDDFLIRQLFYPYLFVYNLNTNKKIMPIFFTYAENVFSFHIYNFEEPNNYSSIKRVKQMDFVLEDDIDIDLEDIQKINRTVQKKTLSDDNIVPFPQADNFLRVLNLLKFIENEPKTKEEVALNYGFDERQSDYYFNSLRYLGYAEKIKRGSPITITEKGKYILQNKEKKVGKLEIVSDILSDPIFNYSMQVTLKEGEVISNNEAKQAIKKYIKKDYINESTMNRRASSIRGWINWILNLIET